MKEVATILDHEEFKEYLESMQENVDRWKEEGLGYVSVTCQLAKAVSEEGPEQVFTSGQLKQIFALAK